MLTKIFRKLHRALGLLFSVLFLVWFLSGIVMIYHSFPKVNQKQIWAQQKSLKGQLSGTDALMSALPGNARPEGLSVEMCLDRPVFQLKGENLPSALHAGSLQEITPPDFPEITRLAVQLCGSASFRTDTLYRLDQWIPFGRLVREFPIYKFTFQDERRQQVYFSSQSGRVLQWTDCHSRFWAWLGAIPHWVYFTSLRQNQSLWITLMIWASGLGSVMCFSGLWVGTRVCWKNRKKGFRSPYKKWWLHWHHISGMIFGLFALTFVFSGMMSLADLPSWLQKGKNKNPQIRFQGRSENLLPLPQYALDYRKIIREIPDVKNITWASFGTHPYYAVTTLQGKRYIDASDSCRIRPFRLSEEMIHQTIRNLYGENVQYTAGWLTDWDRDYHSRRGMLTLPVYRVKIADELHTCHYFNPETLYHRHTDDNSRLKGILYNGLHSLNFRFLTARPLLWNIVMYVLLLGGTFLSLSGVVLTVKWFRRKCSRRKPSYKG